MLHFSLSVGSGRGKSYDPRGTLVLIYDSALIPLPHFVFSLPSNWFRLKEMSPPACRIDSWLGFHLVLPHANVCLSGLCSLLNEDNLIFFASLLRTGHAPFSHFYPFILPKKQKMRLLKDSLSQIAGFCARKAGRFPNQTTWPRNNETLKRQRETSLKFLIDPVGFCSCTFPYFLWDMS